MAELAVVASVVALLFVASLALSFSRLAESVANLAEIVANVAEGLGELAHKIGQEWDLVQEMQQSEDRDL